MLREPTCMMSAYSGDEFHIALRHHLGDDRQSGPLPGLGEKLQPLET